MPVARRTNLERERYVKIEAPLLTIDEVREMNEKSLNDNWDRVCEALESGRTQAEIDAVIDADEDEPAATPKATGMPVPNGAGMSADLPLSRESLLRMGYDEQIRRKDEIDNWLARGGVAA